MSVGEKNRTMLRNNKKGKMRRRQRRKSGRLKVLVHRIGDFS